MLSLGLITTIYSNLKQSLQAGLYFFTYTEWGALLWLAPAWGIIMAYGQRYEYTNPMLVVLCSSWYFLWLLVQRLRKNYTSEYMGQAHTTVALVIRKGSATWPSLVWVIFILAALASFGAYRTTQTIDTYERINPYYLGATGSYTLRLTSLPETAVVGNTTYWRFSGDLVGMVPDKETVEKRRLTAEGEVVAYITPVETIPMKQFLPGQYINVQGVVTKAKVLPEEGRIDLRARYITNHRIGTIYEGVFQSISEEKSVPLYTKISNQILGALADVRYESGLVLNEQLPGELGDMSQSLLLGGGYSSLDASIMDSFAKTGLIHILSVSGSHVALLFGFLFLVASWLGISKKRATYGAIIFVIIYCAIVGFNPPVVRSAIMGIIMGVGIIEGRLYQSRQALNLSAALLLWCKPLLLLDVSFQLSFGATYGILLFSRVIYQRLPKGWSYIMGPLSLCISAQILIYPLQLYYFHLMGLGSFIAAILVGPILDIAILGTALLLLIQLVVPITMGWYLLALLLKCALFLNFTIAYIPGFVSYWSALTVGLAALYMLGCRILYYCMSETSLRHLWQENLLALGLVVLLLIPSYSLGQAMVYVHVIPISQGAAFIVLQEMPFKGRSAWLHVATEGKALSVVSQSAIVNAVHYYGITQPTQISLGDVTTEVKTSITPLLTSLHWSWPALHESQYNQNTYIGETTKDFAAIFEEGPHAFIARGPRGAFLFSNGQISKNHLKLKEMKSYISGTTNGAVAASSDGYRAESPQILVYWPNGNKRSQAEVDPADESRYITGTTVIPDFLL